MKPATKKWLIIGSLSVVSIALGYAYLQYTKIMNYAISFKKVIAKKISTKVFDFDIYLDFQNKSDLKFTIKSQEYKVYINDVFVTRIVNSADVVINKTSTSEIPLNISFDPSKVLTLLKKNIVDIVSSSENVKIRVDVKLKVSIGLITVSIPYVFMSSLKDMMKTNK